MRRRTILKAAVAASLAAPRIARADGPQVLRHIPEADLAVLDPVWTTANVTRNHAFMVFDTLYGADASFNVQPQMVGAQQVENGTDWRLRLRPGLRFHNGEPVLARDAVASIKRWAARSSFGQKLLATADEISAADDTTIRLRMNKPFPVARALSNSAHIMPEHLAMTDATRQVSEAIGSGPFRFLADERVPGARVAYAKFDGYVPRPDGTASFTAGPKIVHVDRVEWTVIPDPSTAASAMLAGETDWWGPTADLVPQLKKSARLRLETIDAQGGIAVMRFNHLYPPFDNPGIRRALLGVVDQAEFMTAVAGDDRTLWRDHVGVFTPGSPMATNAGMEVLTGPRDFTRARRPQGRGLRWRARGGDEPRRPAGGQHIRGAGGRCAEQGRHECRSADHGLGHADPAAREDGRAGEGRVEHGVHLAQRLRHHGSGGSYRAARQRAEGVGGLAHQSDPGGFAQRVVRHRRSRGPAGDLREDPAAVLAGCAVHPARPALRAGGVQSTRGGRAARISVVLRPASRVRR
jgi:hypothetical protein